MTTTAIRCERPGCGGTIDGGYCDTCGLAPEPAAPAAAVAAAPAAGPARCQRPGCGGTIQGGYCDTCGMAPAPASAAPSTSSAAGSAPSGSTGTTGRAGSRRTRSGSSQLLGCDFTERALRFGRERSYRAQAQLAPDRSRRIELVDQANDVRPRTWS